MIVNYDPAAKEKKETRCCIDLGSSYFRLLSVAGLFGQGTVEVERVSQRRIYVGWGEEIASTGSIGREAAVRGARVLEELVSRSVRAGCSRITAVAAGALRSSGDGVEVREMLEDRAGMKILVLSARGEAMLGFAGAVSVLHPGAPAIFADPGGTSTELSWGAGREAQGCAGLHLGTHGAAVFLRRGKRGVSSYISHPMRRSLFMLVSRMIGDAGVPAGDSPLPGGNENPTILFTGGTAVSLAAVWKYMKERGGQAGETTVMSRSELLLTGRRVAALLRSGRACRLPLPRERVRLLLPGLTIVSAITSALRADRLLITTRDLRWGVVLGRDDIERGYQFDEQESSGS